MTEKENTGKRNSRDGELHIEELDRLLSEERYETDDEERSYGHNRRKRNTGRQKKRDMALGVNVPELFNYTSKLEEKTEKRGREEKTEKRSREKKRGWNNTKHAARKTASAVKNVKETILDDTDYDGRISYDDTEHTGRKRKKNEAQAAEAVVKSVLKTVLAQLGLFLKLLLASTGKLLLIVAVISIAAVIILMSAIECATYDFVADEEVHIREIMSGVTGEFSAEISLQKNENGCEAVVCSGELADWKEVIAVWWTLRTHIKETEQWDNYFNGDDYEDIKYIFYQFNHVTYEVTDGSNEEQAEEGKVLNVIITNSTISEVSSHWMLDSEQEAYLYAMLEDDAVWDEVLGTTELSRIAFAEIGNSRDKYREWSGSDSGDISGEFTMWCMNEAGLITDGFITQSGNSQELMQQMNRIGFLHYANEKNEKEGDIIFLEINGQIMSGIVTRTSEDTLSVTLNGFTGHTTVEEQSFDRSSGLIKAYAHIDGFFINALCDINASHISGRGELLWPVGGEYYQVTSPFGKRTSPGGIGSTNHMGIDIAASYGTPIVACAGGTVTAAAYNNSMGYYVKIDHGNGLTTIYMHNSSLQAVVGQVVAAGDVIALAGSTGNSTGTHCHLGVIKANEGYVDPAPYLGIPEGFEGDAGVYVK